MKGLTKSMKFMVAEATISISIEEKADGSEQVRFSVQSTRTGAYSAPLFSLQEYQEIMAEVQSFVNQNTKNNLEVPTLETYTVD